MAPTPIYEILKQKPYYLTTNRLKAYLSIQASSLSTFVISKTHISGQKPRGRQLNTKVCGSESAIFRIISFFLLFQIPMSLPFLLCWKIPTPKYLEHNQTGEILLPYCCTTSRSHSYVTVNNIRVLNTFSYEIHVIDATCWEKLDVKKFSLLPSLTWSGNSTILILRVSRDISLTNRWGVVAWRYHRDHWRLCQC